MFEMKRPAEGITEADWRAYFLAAKSPNGVWELRVEATRVEKARRRSLFMWLWQPTPRRKR
jgi:hypothetical protein